MSFTTELKLPADVAFASLLEAFVADAARRSDLSAEQSGAAAEAATLGFTTIVEEAMAEAREAVRIVAASTPRHLRISLFEHGLPIDDARARRDPKWNRIAISVDEAHWHSRGRAGSELRLLLKRPHGLPIPATPAAIEPQDVPLAPPQEYTIRRFEPADAAGIARAFYLTYGYHYDLPAVYVPARLTELNAHGHYVSIVAVAQDGEIAGHYALVREGDEPIADAGGAIVLPAHRGRNLVKLLREAAEHEAIRIGLAGYYSEPVTDHGRTQHLSQTFGAKVCGISLGTSPRNFIAKHMELSTTTQRQSFMLYVRALQTRDRRTIYVPARHRAIVARMYGELGLPIDFGDGSPGEGPGEFRIGIQRADDIGNVTVQSAGTQTPELVHQAVADLQSVRRLGGIYASLPLEDPGTPALWESMESYGFFFSAVVPWIIDGKDAVHLQMPLTPLDLSALTIISDFGKELLAYIEAERARCTPA
jgi:hypothetical protein